MTFDEFRQQVIMDYDCRPEELMDALELDTGHLVDAFEDRVMILYLNHLMEEESLENEED